MIQPHEPTERNLLLCDDPVVEEIRRIRRQLWEEAGGDIARYVEQARQSAASHIAARSEENDSGSPDAKQEAP